MSREDELGFEGRTMPYKFEREARMECNTPSLSDKKTTCLVQLSHCHCQGCYQLLRRILRVSMDSFWCFVDLACLVDFLVCCSTGLRGSSTGVSFCVGGLANAKLIAAQG